MLHPFLDGVSAGIVGLVLVTALSFAKQVVVTGLHAVVFLLALLVLQQVKHKLTPPLLIVCAAAAGNTLFYPAA